MNADEFYSTGCNFSLPPTKTPKVTLAVDNATVARNAFKLYNPFSTKAKLFKWFAYMFFLYANPLARFLFATHNTSETEFKIHLERVLSTSLYLSVYRATAQDKVVLQLQTKNAEVIGYLKHPLTKMGQVRIENEKRAIDILFAKKIVPNYKQYSYFNNIPFLILEPLDGIISKVDDQAIDDILKSFKRSNSYLLREHPRVIELRGKLTTPKLQDQLLLLDSLCQQSEQMYFLVFEHGDFTPWNIVKTEHNYLPFDFEYFVEDGLEFFDFIKYHYQIATLLEKKTGDDVIKCISKRIPIDEILILLQLFLIKELVRCSEEGASCCDECKLLELLAKQ